ncbi:MAG: hypothetical protein FJ285_06775 [Planctomycetes bacterium]|nr:hypothetical protein [Planctomycetota bacterium]
MRDTAIEQCRSHLARRVWKKTVRLVGMLLVVSAVDTVHAQVDPLRSTELIELLTRYGFDSQQQAAVLDAHEKQVERFVQCMRQSTAAWQVALAVRPADQAAANALVGRGRAAASELDAVEAQVVQAMRQAARPDQTAALDCALLELEQRRNLAVWKAALGSRAQPRPVDWQRVAARMQLTDAQRSALQERLNAQGGDRSAATRLLREAALQSPLARFKSRGGSAVPGALAPLITSDSGVRVGDAEGDTAIEVQTVDPNLGRDFLAALLSQGQVGMKEVAAARARLAECDAQTIDALLTQLNGRGKLRLLSSMATRSGLGPLRVGVTVLQRVVQSCKDLDAARAARMDDVLDRWASAWWPVARKEFTSAAPGKGGLAALLAQDDAPQGGGLRQAQEATSRAAAEIAEIVPDLAPQVLAGLKRAASSGLALPNSDGGVVVEAAGVPGGGGGDGQPIIVAATTVEISVTGDEFDLGDVDMGDMGLADVEMLLSDGDGVVVAGQDISLEMGAPGIGALSFDEEEMDTGEAAGNALAMLYGTGSTRIQQPIKVEQIEGALAAAGVGADLMPVVDQILQDAEATLAEQRQKVQPSAGARVSGGAVAGGLFVMGEDGSLQQQSSKDAEERATLADAVREAILAAEVGAIDTSVMPLTDTKRASAVAWIVPWRTLVKERAAAPSMSFFSQSSSGASSRGDPIMAVMRSQLTAADWCHAGPTIAAECNNLAALTRAWTDADQAERKVRPKPSVNLSPVPPEVSPAAPQGQAGGVAGVQVSSSVSVISTSRDMAGFQAAAANTKKASDSLRSGCDSMVQRVKGTLPPESAQRLQDAWDDQRFPFELADDTSPASRLDEAERLAGSGESAAAIRALRSTWEQRSRAIRSEIVQECEKRSAESAFIIDALRYQRDEWNRKVLRRLSALSAGAS